MDFRSLLQSMTSLSEAETKDTKTGRVHKGDYGTSYEAGDEGAKKQETTRGRGRPKKDADETGEVKKYDTKSVGDVFGAGKKPSKEVGTVSKKHSLKEYIESVEESISEGETIEKKGGRVHKGSYGTSYEAGDEGVKKAETTRGRGRPKKDADETGEVKKYDTKSLGNVFGGGKAPKKEVGKVSASNKIKEGQIAPIQVKPASQTNTQVIQQGDKTLGTVSNPQLAAQIKQSIGKGEMTLNPDEEQSMSEGADEGNDLVKLSKVIQSCKTKEQLAAAQNMANNFLAKHRAGGFSNMGKDMGRLRDVEATLKDKNREIQGSQELGEAKPDFLDVDKDGNKKESFKKAVADKKKTKVKEGRDVAKTEYTDEKVAKILAREKPGMETVKSNDAFYAAVYNELIAIGMTPKSARHLINYDEDFMQDVASAYNHYQKNPSLDEDAKEVDVPTNNFVRTGTSMAAPKGTPTQANRPVQNPTDWKVDPINAATDRAINFISGLRKPKSPFSEGTDMKDIQLESWESQLNSLLTEGITVSSSTGQQGQPDSVSVTASDNDAQSLMQVLRSAGIGGFGAGEQPQQAGYGVVSQGEEEATGTGTQPETSPNVVGDGDDMMALMKKMAGISATGSDTYSDYADEEGSDETALQPADGEEEGEDQSSDDEGEDKEETDEGMLAGAAGAALGAVTGGPVGAALGGAAGAAVEEDEMDEGNAFTGKLKQTPKGGEFKMGDKSYKDTSAIEEGGFDPEQGDGGGAGGGDIKKEETCNECGCAMSEGHECDSEQVEENYANSAEDPATTELMKLKALLAMGNDLHKQKSSQAIGNPVRVTESKQMINEWKKLSGI